MKKNTVMWILMVLVAIWIVVIPSINANDKIIECEEIEETISWI